jgi:hypothetical protein
VASIGRFPSDGARSIKEEEKKNEEKYREKTKTKNRRRKKHTICQKKE